MKKHSTGALTQERLAKQNQRYAENHHYDYVIIGTGMAALTIGALLAKEGKRVCLLEAHDTPGGYAHSFQMKEFSFCAQIHYIWGCAPGECIYEFLRYLGLEQEITFELFDPDGYDHMVMPDGKRIKIPYGYEKLAENIDQAYPGQKKAVLAFTKELERIQDEIQCLPEDKKYWWKYLFRAYPLLNLFFSSQWKTLQQLFDKHQLSKEAQAILIAQAGDFMAPPNELSILAYIGLFGGYNRGAYYPTKHFNFFVQRLAQYITDHEGCHIYYETLVTKIATEKKEIQSVETADGKIFRAPQFICNMDPQKASELIGREKFPKKFLPALTYDYSPSALVIYLGLKGIKLKDYGFGKYNVWHLEQWDMNQIWKESLAGNFEKPWVFLSAPTLHSSAPGIAPTDGEILEIGTLVDYNYFKNLQNQSYKKYSQAKMAVANRLLDLVEEKYIPNLRQHIKVRVVGTPTTNEDFCLAPQGNSYGSHLTPKNLNWKRLKAKTPFKNFFWCNASSGYAGVYGTIGTGMELYMKLTGNFFFLSSQKPKNKDVIAKITQQMGN